ncbi:MAG: hypothetical protein HFF18_03905 [Oscillospiraceae bacterium]|nr:hypothetical protein [Oscillospiraceae bacterium]
MSFVEITFLFALCCTAVMALALSPRVVRGTGTERKQLLSSAVPMTAVLLLRYGGEWVLSLNGMGWRCTPGNVMSMLGIALLAVTVWRWMKGLNLKNLWEVLLYLCGAAALCAVCVGAFTFSLDVWRDEVVVRDGQTMVKASNRNGGSGEVRCFVPINGLVRGEELDFDWYG